MKHKGIEIQGDKPFENCKLKRETYALTLTGLISSYSDGFVLSVNNQWGTGKTTFIKMWQAHLQNQGFRTLYFNAWENDFDADPIVALMSELGTLTDEKADANFNSLIKKAAVISHSVVPGLIKALIARYISTEVLADVLSDAGRGATDLFKDQITEYANKKKGLVEFRSELEKYIKERTDDKPLVLFIDELDRCRPSYAVELLEQVKHFFSVAGIVFVLAIDKQQLSNAIRGFYGSEQIDSNEYLRRFIDMEFTLPNPPVELFVEYLYDYFKFDDYFKHKERSRYQGLTYDREIFIRFAKQLIQINGLTLRQQEKLLGHARVALNTFTIGNYLFPNIFLLLIYLRDYHVDLYRKLAGRSASPQEILDDLAVILKDKLTIDRDQTYLFVESRLLKLYFNYYQEIYYQAKIVEMDGYEISELLVRPHSDNTSNFKDFIREIQQFNHHEGGSVSLSHLLNRVSLLENIKTF